MAGNILAWDIHGQVVTGAMQGLLARFPKEEWGVAPSMATRAGQLLETIATVGKPVSVQLVGKWSSTRDAINAGKGPYYHDDGVDLKTMIIKNRKLIFGEYGTLSDILTLWTVYIPSDFIASLRAVVPMAIRHVGEKQWSIWMMGDLPHNPRAYDAKEVHIGWKRLVNIVWFYDFLYMHTPEFEQKLMFFYAPKFQAKDHSEMRKGYSELRNLAHQVITDNTDDVPMEQLADSTTQAEAIAGQEI
jgi:hypothetical protein